MTAGEKLERKEATEDLLSMPRRKKRSFLISLGYRASRVGDAIFGKHRMLRFFLDGSWLLWRFAFERSGEIYGGEFHNRAKALSEEFLRRWISENDAVVDVGCGVGRWCQVSAKYAGSVVGIDYSESLINLARSNTTATNVEYIVGDVTKDLAGREFDLALFIHVVEHIDSSDEILNRLRQVAKKLIVEVPDFECDPLNLIRLEMNRPFYSDGDHVREYTQSILNSQLERNGWIILENRKNGGAVLAVAERGTI